VTVDPESLGYDVKALLTGAGNHPICVDPSDSHFAEIIQNSDGTYTKVSRAAGATYPGPLRLVEVLQLSPRDAAMLGLYGILKNLTWQSFNLKDVATRTPIVAITPLRFDDVVFDWPSWNVTDALTSKALITSIDAATYEQPGEVRLLDETAELFAPGSILRHLGTQRIPLQIVCWCAHADQRRALESKLMSALAAEERSDLPGRRLVIPEYFNRVARYAMRSTMRPDDESRAAANEHVLEVPVEAEIEHVQLVYSPGYMLVPHTDVE
jgi:hypothetical protein